MNGDTKGIVTGAGKKNQEAIAGKRYLLVIAIDKYDFGKTGCKPLQYPVKDANTFSILLKDEYAFDNIYYLLDDECKDDRSVKAKILEIKKDIEKEGKDKDHQLVVLFSGHGITEDNKGFWALYDASPDATLNWAVTDVINTLTGICSQTLLIADCCFSGTITESVYLSEVFEKAKYENKLFSVITAGNKFEQVPDKSQFMEALVDVLRFNDISSFNSLKSTLSVVLKKRNNTCVITDFDTPNQLKKPFLLQRRDKVSYELANSFYELNYSDQLPTHLKPRLFNMVYLRGEKECGHQIFMQRYLSDIDKNQVSILNYHIRTTSLGGGFTKPANYSLWEELAKVLGVRAESETILDQLFHEVQFKNWLMVIKIRKCDEVSLEKAIKEFWKAVTEYATKNKTDIKLSSYRIYIFLWDERGVDEDVSDVVTREKFNDIVPSSDTMLFPFSPVKDLDIEVDVKDGWYYQARQNYEELRKDCEFTNLDFDKIEKPYNIENVICRISKLCKRDKIYNILFSQHKLCSK